MTRTKKETDYSVVTKLENLNRANLSEAEQLHIDLFLLSCYLGGPSLRTMSCMEKSDLQNDVLRFVQEELLNNAEVVVMDRAKVIIERYEQSCLGELLLPIIPVEEMHNENYLAEFTEVIHATLRKYLPEYEVVFSDSRSIYIERMFALEYPLEIIAKHTGLCNYEIKNRLLEWDEKTHCV